MTFFCIADKDSSIGFKLAGVETREVLTKNEALQALSVALAMENVGIILVTEKIASFIREEIDKLIYQQELPLVLEIPSRGLRMKRRSVGEFLREAIGVSV